MAFTFKDHLEGEQTVYMVLRSTNPDQETVDEVLRAFLMTRKAEFGSHRLWVHSLSSVTKMLWDRRLTDWIKTFNEVAFSGANEFGDHVYCERLIRDFATYSRLEDDPADFGLTPETLKWTENVDRSSMSAELAWIAAAQARA